MAHELTIVINNDCSPNALDCELLPPNQDYSLNPSQNFPALCVLTSQAGDGFDFGQVYLFNAYTGQFLEELGTYFGPDPLFKDCDLRHLDTDDDNWEIHVTWYDLNGDAFATVFTHI